VSHHQPRRERRRARPLLLLLIYLSGCTSWQVEQVAPAQLIAERQPSRVRVTRADQSRVVLRDPTIVGDTLVGALDSAKAVWESRVALSEVQRIEVRHGDAGRTIGLALAAAGLVVFGLYKAANAPE
jgi:hypothetical protein